MSTWAKSWATSGAFCSDFWVLSPPAQGGVHATCENNMALLDIHVPDIGDFDEVAVIELLVKPGDTIRAEQSLITVESDKA